MSAPANCFIPIACLLCGLSSFKKGATYQRFQKNKMYKWVLRLSAQNKAWIYKPSWKEDPDRVEGGQEGSGEFPLAMLWKSHCNLCKNYDTGEGSNPQNRICIPFCNLWQAILRLDTLIMVCAFFYYYLHLIFINVHKVQCLSVDFTQSDIHIKTAERNNLLDFKS